MYIKKDFSVTYRLSKSLKFKIFTAMKEFLEKLLDYYGHWKDDFSVVWYIVQVGKQMEHFETI